MAACTKLIHRYLKPFRRKDEENLSEARSLINSKLHAGIQGGETESGKEGYNNEK